MEAGGPERGPGPQADDTVRDESAGAGEASGVGEYGWFVETFGREVEPLWFDPYTDEDMSTGPDESKARITDFYTRARAAADRVLTELPLDTLGKPAWRDDECSLRWVLVRMTAETARHAGHMDIVRELIDGVTGAYEPA
ncbi:hypothetical protein GCM10023084_06680 [Streptomyces lacrimifluminis]